LSLRIGSRLTGWFGAALPVDKSQAGAPMAQGGFLRVVILGSDGRWKDERVPMTQTTARRDPVLFFNVGPSMFLALMGLVLAIALAVALTNYSGPLIAVLFSVAVLAGISWMSAALIRQVVFYGGAAAWVLGGRFATTHWSVQLADIEEVSFVAHRRIGLSWGGAIVLRLKDEKRKYLPTAPLAGDGPKLAQRVRELISEKRT
jgi:hypothetical protein